MRNLLPLTSTSGYKIAFLSPQTFEETRDAIAALKDGEILLFNLAELGPVQAQRISDFVSGCACALSGHKAVVGNGVVLFAPPTVQITVPA
ncbi:MAG: cell division protein SepF [Acaryochloridaceae cyanobacterium RU_4_10]|jgi:cell division inhibitor SepF|nr:cell division protein SepF [Acaryochloridaceae cyanobacterium RU_4_10]